MLDLRYLYPQLEPGLIDMNNDIDLGYRLEQLRSLFQASKTDCIDRKAEILSLFYLYEGIKQEASFLAELQGLLSNFRDRISLSVTASILILLREECKKLDDKKRLKQYEDDLCRLDKSSLYIYQIRYIEEINSDEESQELKGKEMLLVQELMKGPVDKVSLIVKIYGEKTDFYSAEGRFKALLSRLRKKLRRKIILNTMGHYELY